MVKAGQRYELIQLADENMKVYKWVSPETIGVVTEVDDDEMVISEGKTSKKMQLDSYNFMALGVHRHIWFRRTCQDLDIDLDGRPKIVNSITKYREYEGVTRGYVKWLGELSERLGKGRQENYDYRLFRVITRNAPHLNIGLNPFHTHTYYARQGPVLLRVEEEEEEKPPVEVNSAADW